MNYQIQKSKIVYEVLNHEVIIVDFNSGNYYALSQVARHIWQCVEKQMSVDRISQLLAHQYQRADIAADVYRFVEQLLEQGLIAPTDEPPSSEELDIEWGEYDPPRLLKFTDIQNLILLDPIHEAGEAGWPHQK